MLSTDQPPQTEDEAVPAQARPACVALVPVVTTTQWAPIPDLRHARPNSTFVTHLIATATRAPQTRILRRATPTDAQTAYKASQREFRDAGIRMRQTI
jgi:hypothetical protein